MTTNILVTGGAGYLGSILVPALLDVGHSVTVLDNFMWRQNSLSACCANPAFDIVHGDARNSDTLKPLVAKADIIIPLAALVGAPLCDKDPVGATSTNRDAVRTLLDLASREQAILLPVTNSGYGVGEHGSFCTEESPLRPISRYGVDKVAAEAMVLERGNAISFRLATVFGMAPRMRLDLLVNDFVYRALNDRSIVLFESHFKRNYIHVRDVARAFLHGLNNFEVLRNNVYNVGLSDANISKWELCEKIREHLPDLEIFEAPIGKDPDKRDYIVSNEKIEKTGYMPQHSLDLGIQELVKGFRMIRNNQYSNT
ncbi:SDR family oxidoreductase [Nisaea sp.]|uniref:NAD-dependent epimerase/dehydratase family protein n=1 Tax=Nisaea sp. TaxID=2024842 RepID=UPI0032ED9842